LIRDTDGSIYNGSIYYFGSHVHGSHSVYLPKPGVTVTVTQTRLSQSHKTLAPLGTITMARAGAKWLYRFSKLTQLIRIHLKQAHKRSN
jgi:hypothetical protein